MNLKPTFHFGEEKLTASIAIEIAKGTKVGILSESVQDKINKSSDIVQSIAKGSKAVYGINTGFGPLCTTQISPNQTRELQSNLLKSHAVGVGEPIADIISKIMMILKVQALCKGYSGVNLDTINRIVWMIDHDIVPVVPSQGSVGASGDLAPLSHLFLPLIGEGHVTYQGQKLPTSDVLNRFKLTPIDLGPKEGLGLINGTQFIAAHAVMVVDRMYHLLNTADICGTIMLEGLLGSTSPFKEELHQVRPFAGNQHVAERIRNLLIDSEIVPSHANCGRVQDPYSLRCMPQVHGASRTAWLHLKDLVEIEINSVTDNPVIFSEGNTISGGNFHGQPLAMALDYACIAAAEIGNISDRRCYLSLEGNTPGVPKLLMKDLGTNSGFMIPQYTAAAIASENKGLTHPASVDSIPTSLGQEDHVSMGSISSRKALQVVENVEKILAIELMSACQAYDYHAPLKSGKAIDAIHKHVRTHIPHIEKDTVFYPLIEKALEIVKSGQLLEIEKTMTEHLSCNHGELFDQY